MDVINKIKEWWKKVFENFKNGSGTITFEQMSEIDHNLGSHFMGRR